MGGAIEAGVLALVCLAPWAFGATAPKYVFFLDLGLAGLMVLWGRADAAGGATDLAEVPRSGVPGCPGPRRRLAGGALARRPAPPDLARHGADVRPAPARAARGPARRGTAGRSDTSRRLDAQRRSRRHAQGAGQAPGRPDALRDRAQQRRSGRRPEAPGHGRPDQRIAPGPLRAGPGVLIGPADHLLGLSDSRQPVRPVHQPEPLRVLHEHVHGTWYWPAPRPACGARRAGSAPAWRSRTRRYAGDGGILDRLRPASGRFPRPKPWGSSSPWPS